MVNILMSRNTDILKKIGLRKNPKKVLAILLLVKFSFTLKIINHFILFIK